MAPLLVPLHNFTKGRDRLGCRQRRRPSWRRVCEEAGRGCSSPDRKIGVAPPSRRPHFQTPQTPKCSQDSIQLCHKVTRKPKDCGWHVSWVHPSAVAGTALCCPTHRQPGRLPHHVPLRPDRALWGTPHHHASEASVAPFHRGVKAHK